MAEKKKTAMVGMSGGVDSTVTALLLQQEGYDVVGVTFRLWSPEDEEDLPDNSCCSLDNVRDAKMVCTKLGIPHYVFNYKELFKKKVVEPFVATYLQGKTPNPCVDCNRFIKFDDFLKRALGMGYDYIATGHYARIEQSKEGQYRFKKALSPEKDQTYFLYNLTTEQLEHVLMPLGDYTKPQVREIAKENGFVVANKPDSQDICFVPDGDYGAVLESLTGKKPEKGDFVDSSGAVIGRHQGISNYTIGQRKGLGVTFGIPMYVIGINLERNQVILGEDEQLFSTTMSVEDVSWVNFDRLKEPMKAEVKIRSTAKVVPCTITPHGESCIVKFEEPQRAVTPGQAAVFYVGDYVIGGGTIV